MWRIFLITILALNPNFGTGRPGEEVEPAVFPTYAHNESAHPPTDRMLTRAKRAKESQPAADDPEGNWGRVEEGFQLSVRFDKAEFIASEPITGSVIVRNVSPSLLRYAVFRGSGVDTPVCNLTVVDGHGIPVTRFSQVVDGSSTVLDLLPSTQRKHPFRLDQRFELNKLDDYAITAERTIPKLDKSGHAEVKSGTAIIRIMSPPPGQQTMNAEGWHLWLEVARSNFVAGASVPVTMVLSNGSASSRIISVSSRTPCWTGIGELLVRNAETGQPHGCLLSDSDKYGFVSMALTEVKPGEVLRFKGELATGYGVTNTGAYIVSGIARVRSESAAEASIKLETVPLTISLTPDGKARPEQPVVPPADPPAPPRTGNQIGAPARVATATNDEVTAPNSMLATGTNQRPSLSRRDLVYGLVVLALVALVAAVLFRRRARGRNSAR